MKKHINNETAYFGKIARNMQRKSRKKEKAGENHEPFNDEIYFDKAVKQTPMDEEFQKSHSLGWIEIMENPNLHKAIKKLSEDEQIFITHLLIEHCTQQELADIYKINQSSVFYKLNKIRRKIKNFMFRK